MERRRGEREKKHVKPKRKRINSLIFQQHQVSNVTEIINILLNIWFKETAEREKKANSRDSNSACGGSVSCLNNH